MKPKVLLYAGFVLASQGQGHYMWYKLVEVNSAYKQSTY